MAVKERNRDHKLISLSDPKSPITEAYRTLRTNIQFASLDKPLKRIMVTSAGPGEGKSTVAANLGVTMAMAGFETIIVDCDLRKPTQHKKLGLNNFIGLTNVLYDKMPLEGIIQKTKVEGLSLLATGPVPPNPAEVLGSKKIEVLMGQLDKIADIVIIDTPPVIAVTDAAILSRVTDGVILNIEMGKTKRDMAKKAKELLENVNAKILGTVLNKVDMGEQSYYYYYGERDRKKVK